MNWYRTLTVMKTDLRQLIQARDFWLPMSILGGLFFVVVPTILLLSITSLGEVGGVVQQVAGLAVDHLVDEAADRAGDDRPRLQHALGDGQPEALGEALLHDDAGVALERVDDHRVLLDVVHRDADQLDAVADGVGELAPRRPTAGLVRRRRGRFRRRRTKPAQPPTSPPCRYAEARCAR